MKPFLLTIAFLALAVCPALARPALAVPAAGTVQSAQEEAGPAGEEGAVLSPWDEGAPGSEELPDEDESNVDAGSAQLYEDELLHEHLPLLATVPAEKHAHSVATEPETPHLERTVPPPQRA